MQLYQLANRVLLQHPVSRGMHLQAHQPLVVPISPRVRLTREGEDFVTLQDIQERDCEARGVSYLDAAVALRAMQGKAGNPMLVGPRERQGRMLNLFVGICEDQTNTAAITQYLSRRLPTAQARWCVRRELTKQWALSALLSHAFHIGHRDPTKFVVSIASGRLLSLAFRPTYQRDTGRLQDIDHVPFRLTPALQHVLTPVGVHGVFAETMMGAADALHAKLAFLEDYATLYLKGDMVPWHEDHRASVQEVNAENAKQHYAQEATDQSLGDGESESGHNSVNGEAPRREPINLHEVVDQNVTQVLLRIREMAPLDGSPEHDRTTCFAQPSPTLQPSCLNQHVHDLVRAASHPVALCRQGDADPLWAPHF